MEEKNRDDLEKFILETQNRLQERLAIYQKLHDLLLDELLNQIEIEKIMDDLKK